MRRAIIALGVLSLSTTACSDKAGEILDSGPLGDGPVAIDTGMLEGGGQLDTGAGDTSGTIDTGGAGDTGGQTDGSPKTCDPNFGQQQACGGTLSGTKWKYTEGCVADAAFDDLKKNCPGATVSNVAYAMPATNTLQFFANGNLVRVFNGSISGKASFPQACTGFGCPALQGVLVMALAKYPGSTVNCTAASGGGCDCDVMLKLFAFNGGTYTTSGSVVTVTAAGNQYPYHYCVSGSVLTYAGTAQNPNDRNVTYVLQQTP